MKIREIVVKLIKLKRLWMLLLLPTAKLLMVAAKHIPSFTEEVFAKGIFHIYSQVLSFITGLIPFSLAEMGIVLGLAAIPGILIWRVVLYVKKRGERLFFIGKDLISLMCIGSVVYFMLVMGCSINYYRKPVADYLGLQVRDSSVEELAALHAELSERANAVRSQLTLEDEAGVYMLSVSTRELAKWCDESFDALSEEYQIFHGVYPKPKRIIFSRVMSKTELTGVYVPFTMEANVNVDVPDYSIASTMCHELAHLRGFIREDEANYISYLACMASDSPELQYSGLMEALILTGNVLYSKNPDKYYEIRAGYDAGVNRDLAANSAYWAQFHDTKISNTTEKLNDTYLKANNQTDGVQSYGRMVDLLLAEYRKNHGLD